VAQQHSTTQSAQVAQIQELFTTLSPTLFSPPGLLLLGCIVLMLYTSLTGGGSRRNKMVLARARLGGTRERNEARQLACQQIENQKYNEFALYIGTPKGTGTKVIDGQKVLHIPTDPRTTYLPNAQANIILFGAPETGKSAFGINPLTRSAIDQGIPVIYYDFKGHEDPPPSGEIAVYADQNDYQVSVYSPGSPDTCVCNILDFLDNEADPEAARDIAEVLNRNLKLSDNNSSNGNYFSESGDQLAQAVMMLAKSSLGQADVVLCQKLLTWLSDPEKLLERLDAAEMSDWTRLAFDQYLSTSKSPETAASIASTASLLFNRFMVPSALPAFCGKTTLPLDLNGKQLVIFRMNPKNKTTVGPLIAAAMTMLVNRNIFRPRPRPLLLVLDEVKTIYLTKLSDWLNQMRSSGLGTIVAAQSLGVLEETYGKDALNSIAGGCATHLVYQLNDGYTAKIYSEACGNEQVDYTQRSRSHGKGGANHSLADHNQTRPLVEVQQLQKFPVGKVLLINRGYKDGKEVRIPVIIQLRLPASDSKAAIDKRKKLWPRFQAKLIAKSTAKPIDEELLNSRTAEAKQLLALPEEREQRENLLQQLAMSY